MRIGIKILNFVLATILLTSAALHQEKADVFEFDLVLGVQTEEVGPGDYIECSPVVTNIGNIPGNVYLKIIQPMVQEEGTPLYVFEINDKWMKKEELVLGDEVVITYMYSEPLKPMNISLNILKLQRRLSFTSEMSETFSPAKTLCMELITYSTLLLSSRYRAANSSRWKL